MSTHEINLALASGANLTILYFSEHDLRWIFTYRYVGLKAPGADPDVFNEVKLIANYADGLLTPQLVLTMHVIVPSRLGQQFFVGMDISPGAKTYLEFNYARRFLEPKPGREGGDGLERTAEEYRLIEICKGARERVQLDGLGPAIVKAIEFPFPVPDRLPIKGGVQVPFLLNDGSLSHFELPTRTLR
jgi:hypothetical protein